MGSLKAVRSPPLPPLPPPSRIFRISIRALNVFSHIFSPGGLTNALLSQSYVLITVPTVGTVDRVYVLRTREKVRGL